MGSVMVMTLSEIATAVTAEIMAAEQDARSAVGHARRAGELLSEAKALVAHGDWLPWLRANCAVAERTAQAYMRLARRLAELPQEEAQRVADLPLREALPYLAAASKKPEQDGDAEPARLASDVLEELFLLARVTLEGDLDRLEGEIDEADLKAAVNALIRIREAGAVIQHAAAEHKIRCEVILGRLLAVEGDAVPSDLRRTMKRHQERCVVLAREIIDAIEKVAA